MFKMQRGSESPQSVTLLMKKSKKREAEKGRRKNKDAYQGQGSAQFYLLVIIIVHQIQSGELRLAFVPPFTPQEMKAGAVKRLARPADNNLQCT